MAQTQSIERLRVYIASRTLEDTIYELVKRLPETEFYLLGNDLRRTSAAISHHLAEYHNRYSHNLKLEALHRARSEAEHLRQLLEEYAGRGFGSTTQLQSNCTIIVKQCWGLIRYFKGRQTIRHTARAATAVDELVAARS